MPKIARDTNDPAPVEEAIRWIAPEVSVTTSPVLICGVNRKINIGNFETVDVYAGLALPLHEVSLADKEALTAAVEAAAEYGFGLTSQEAGARYQLIKELTQGK